MNCQILIQDDPEQTELFSRILAITPPRPPFELAIPAPEWFKEAVETLGATYAPGARYEFYGFGGVGAVSFQSPTIVSADVQTVAASAASSPMIPQGLRPMALRWWLAEAAFAGTITDEDVDAALLHVQKEIPAVWCRNPVFYWPPHGQK
jgi:hypothetical protein